MKEKLHQSLRNNLQKYPAAPQTPMSNKPFDNISVATPAATPQDFDRYESEFYVLDETEAGEEESGSDEVTEIAANYKTMISKKSKKEDKK